MTSYRVPTVAIDARDAFAPQLRGWGRYAKELIAALPSTTAWTSASSRAAAPGPEVLFEQVGLPVRLRRMRPTSSTRRTAFCRSRGRAWAS